MTTMARPRFEMPHPAILLDNCPQLLGVIDELEAGTYPQPDTAVWRDDLPHDLAVRLAKATGATDEQIAAMIAEPAAKSVAAEPTTWVVEVTAADGTERTEYRSGKDAHRVASDASRNADHATVTFNGCVTTYRDGTGTGPDAEPAPQPAPDRQKWANVDAGPQQLRNLKKAMSALLTEGKTFDELTGVIGGEERRWTMSAPFSPVRPEVVALHDAIKTRYGHQVTRATARAITADYEAALPEAVKSRPTVDKRRTPEEEAERLAAEQAAAEEAERAEPAPGCKRLTITHDHKDGTFIHGSCKGDGVYELIGPRTVARFKYFPSIRMIGIPQSRDHLAKRGQIQAAAEALRKAGHVVTIEIDDTPRDVADVKADRAERLDTRAERLAAKAARLQAEGDARHAAADAIGERFAGGQPILRGHHSERRARRDQERMQHNDRAAADAYRKAERTAAAASVVGTADAYRERPGVIRRRIDKTEAELRKTNHHINGTRPANDWRGAYSYNPQPAAGEWLEQLTARKTFLEHQLAADQAALAELEAAGYVMLTRETVHKGDIVTWAAFPHDVPATVTRVNPKTVSLDRTRWPSKLGYEQIKTIKCPHEGTETTVTARRPAAAAEPRPAPVVVAQPTPERPQPVHVDARFEFFPTPAAIVARMIAAAGIEPGMTVLEPSAGAGAIAAPLVAAGATVDTYELNMHMSGRLKDAGVRNVYVADFPTVTPRPDYDRVLMNPPFANRADVRHVLHALQFLRPGGRLVAIMSAGVEFRDDKLTAGFRAMVDERGGTIEKLPDEAFKDSGTSVRTVLVTIPAPPPAVTLTPDGQAVRVELDGRAIGRIRATEARNSNGRAPVFWAITPAGAMTPHASQDAAAKHLVNQR